MGLAEKKWLGWWWVTKTALRGLVVVALTQRTTDSASWMRKGGSIRIDSEAPTISVVMLERPLVEEEWWQVCRGILVIRSFVSGPGAHLHCDEGV